MKDKKKHHRKHLVKEDKHISQFALSPNNRITYVYKTNSQGILIEITCVSLEINILGRWITIIFYDNHHAGRLHRHTRIAYNDEADITDYKNVKMKGSLNNLLTWSNELPRSRAARYLKNNCHSRAGGNLYYSGFLLSQE